ncbi:MAG: fluoride efflux transporter CrcB [Ruminococcus sp.]|jgi:CrcB protein|nr:fluoride efflux transporter CrcB [Ruminococcus sp.]
MGFLFVGLGGAVGAMLRYAISLIPYKGGFPLLTFITNILGALLIGFIVGYASKRNVNDSLMLFLKTGLCGGFTTFSTFSLEAYNLFVSGSRILAVCYAAFSAVCCIFGVWLGITLSTAVVKD